MKSKIIKISIILVFMLFSAGLFNFCFALSLGADFEITNTITMPNNKKLNFVKSNLEYELPNIDNVVAGTSGLDISKFIDCYNNNGYVLSYSSFNDNYRLKFLVPSVSNVALNYNYSGDSTAFYFVQNGDTTYTNTAQYMAVYNFNTCIWTIYGPFTNYILGLGIWDYIVDCQLTIYDSKWDTGNIIYEPIKQPTDEELIANCDFKVNFKFAPKSEDFPNDDIGTRWSWPCRLLLQHSMTNWDENYNVKVKLSVIDKTQPNGLYYDLYDSNGEEIQKKGHIKEEILTKDINNGDFFLMFTDNLQDKFKLEYEIYNKLDTLILKKIYTFQFTKSGLTYYNSTGTIIKEQTQDANGNDISSENNSFDTNGYDNTNNNYDDDYYDVSNLNNLASSANETINLAQKCFAILPGFIWAMVGIFLSVCIALRILGR